MKATPILFSVFFLCGARGALITLDGDAIRNSSRKVIDIDENANCRFGWSIAQYNDHIVVGGPQRKDGKTPDVGSTTYFVNNGKIGGIEQRILLTGSDVGGQNGLSVAINSRFIIVGSPNETFYNVVKRQGGVTAYHYNKKGNIFNDILANDGEVGDSFGYSVDINENDQLAIGAYNDNDRGENSGSVYIFFYSNPEWMQQEKLVPNDLAEGDHFGNSLSMSNVYLAIGAYKQDSKFKDSGAVYVYKKEDNNWIQQAKVTSPNMQDNGLFGSSVGIDSGRLVIGAPNEDSGKGNVYVYAISGTSWKLEAKLQKSGKTDASRFGSSVSIDKGAIVVGAPRCDGYVRDSGCAWAFNINNTHLKTIAKLLAADGQRDDNFGLSVSILNGIVFVGSPQNDAVGINGGAIYLYNDLGLTEVKPVPRSETPLTTQTTTQERDIVNGTHNSTRRRTGGKTSIRSGLSVNALGSKSSPSSSQGLRSLPIMSMMAAVLIELVLINGR